MGARFGKFDSFSKLSLDASGVVVRKVAGGFWAV
jgi:hypothetical protein